jgi:DNA-binding MarR family transcriptional regulator
MVQRLPDPTDRRRVLVQLTDKARRLAADVYEPLTGEMEQSSGTATTSYG